MWIEMLLKIFEVCILPLLGILTTYLVSWIKAQSELVKEKTDSELARKYIDMVEGTISNCVIATNQTYVDALKEQGAFGKEEQIIAFNKTYEQVMLILTDDAKVYLNEMVGDLQAFIIALIEAQVKLNK